jgi:hypothetical protein
MLLALGMVTTMNGPAVAGPAMISEVDDAALEESYGRGAHAYFSGDHRRAHELMSSVIAAGSKDPRAYYFRGLSSLHLGREPDARLDFQAGAKLEISEGVSPNDVSKSLERVQGRGRLLLEEYRGQARVALARQREQRRLLRYEAIRRAAPTAPPKPDAGAPVPDGEVMEAPPAKPAANDDPFAAPATKKPEADPFGNP